MEKVVNEKTALAEVVSFLKKHKSKEFRRGKLNESIVMEEYLDMIEAVEDGLLVFNDKGVPSYTLRSPLFPNSEDKGLIVSKTNFRTRIKEADKNLVMDGLNIQKQMGTYTIKYISFICQLSIPEVKELESEDFNLINQVCSVF